MKPLASLVLLLCCVFPLAAEVKVTPLKDRVRVEIEGELFTEWRFKDWMAPYFYPVIGPNGQSITRHYPMKKSVPGESQDHSHHRSLRFAHSDVNGQNYWWWRLGKERETSKAEIQLEKIEKTASGKTGELIAWIRWVHDGNTVLRQKMHITLTPLPQRQVLMDYDITLVAGKEPVQFGDIKDGGLYVRVAGTMKAAQHFKAGGAKLQGTIRNSRGQLNTDTWGQRAEWVDFHGPDASGKTVGIAMFDHPKNLRFPTHWHSRTYGLLTANRFGESHFDPKNKKPRGTSCRPWSDLCPACKERKGDYNLPAGQRLTLRHRLYFHHGDTKQADVAGQYQVYIQ